MKGERADTIAREAARLMRIGRAQNIESAIRAAAESLGYEGRERPSAARVRKHAQAMAMQAEGSAGYEDARRTVWTIAQELMSLLEHALPDAKTLLVGRAARGHIDTDVSIHLRIHTRATVSDLAKLLVEAGYEEPAFTTAETRVGRMSQLRFTEQGIDIVLTRCPSQPLQRQTTDFFTGKPLPSMDLKALEFRLA